MSTSDEPRGPPDETPAEERHERTIPDPDTVESESILESPRGRRYRVIRTTQRDEYEEGGAEKGEDRPPPADPPRNQPAADDDGP